MNARITKLTPTVSTHSAGRESRNWWGFTTPIKLQTLYSPLLKLGGLTWAGRYMRFALCKIHSINL